MMQHPTAVLIIMGTLAIWAFYALFALAGVLIAIGFVLELLHKLLVRIIGRAR